MISVPQISKDANLSASSASIKVSNCDQAWNIFLDDKTNLGRTVQLGLRVDIDVTWEVDATWDDLVNETWDNIDAVWAGLGDYNWNELDGAWDDYDAVDECWGVGSDYWNDSLTFFTGTVEDVSFDGAEMSLKSRDKMNDLLNIRLGSGQDSIDYYSSAYNPADLVWDILTTYGYLDSTESSANVDIDYDSWSDWWTDCDTLDYSVKGRFAGQTIKNVLQTIKELTVSYIWINGEGKFKFKRPIPPYPAEEGIDHDNSTCEKIDTSIEKSNLCNELYCYYGYDPDTDTWEDNYYANDLSSQLLYGINSVTLEDKTVWHVDESSAKSYADRHIEINKTPLELIEVTIMAMGYLIEIGDINTITETLKKYNATPGRVERIIYSLRDGTVRTVMQNIGGEQLAAFYLDDVYYGLLDESYNPLL